MIDLYTWTTPNGRKVSMALEELGLEYEVHPINIGEDAQFDPAFLKISPNNKIPAIVDRDNGTEMMESGAILLYLAKKTGKLVPESESGYWEMVEWLMWQMGGYGPMLGQAHHFLHFNPGKAAYAEERFAKEVRRLYGVLDRRLEGRDFVVGELTVADYAIWPWASRHQWQGIDLNEFPNIRDWYVRIAERSSTEAGYHVPHFTQDILMP